jgi:threonine/homoserine/homoserine lactone efflux protein
MDSVVVALIAYTAAATLLTITPGLDTALVLRTAATEGARRALWSGLGIITGCLVWATLVPVPAFTVGAIHALLGLIWFVCLIAATRPLIGWLRRPAVVKMLDRITGGIFIAFGVRLAVASNVR